MIKVGIVIGSTRPGRLGAGVADWVHGIAMARGDAKYELVDLVDAGLPQLDEPVPALMSGGYTQPHTMRWSATVAAYDAFVFVTPEYNRSMPGSLKTAIDFLYAEWTGKSAAFVSYGIEGGVRAVEHLRAVTAAVGLTGALHQVTLTLRDDFTDGVLQPRAHQADALATVLDEVVAPHPG